MSPSEVQLKRINDKLQHLLKQHAIILKENNRLKEELQQVMQKTSTQQKNVDELKQQVGVLKLNAGEMSGEDKKEFEKKINVYLKEIDRCIALLGE